MKYCTNCKVKINKSTRRCILCNAVLSPLSEPVDEVFPHTPYVFRNRYLLKIPMFITLSVILVSLIFVIFFPAARNILYLVMFGVAILWLGFYQIIRRKHRTHRKIINQVVNISLLALFFDWRLGWSAWSLTYVLPITFITAIILMYISGKIMRLPIRAYMNYALIGGVLGIIPSLFVSFNWTTNVILPITCVAISAIFLSAIAIFKGNEIIDELKRRMHF